MSVDYSANLGVGYKVTYEQLVKAFGVRTDPVTHQEQRYDHKTGKLLADPVTVMDKEGALGFKTPLGKLYEDSEEFLEELCTTLECCYQAGGCLMAGPEEEYYVFEPVLEVDSHEDDSVDDGNFTAGASVSYDAVCAVRPQLEDLGARLLALGVETEAPRVYVVGLIS